MNNQCDNCGKTFANKSSFRYHVEHNVCCKKQHNICGTCGKTFTTKSGYAYHVSNCVCVSEMPLNSDQQPHKKIKLKLKL